MNALRKNIHRHYNFSGGSGNFGRRRFQFGPRSFGSVIKFLLLGNVAIFLLQVWIGPEVVSLLGLTPQRFYSDFPNLLYQPFTYMFLHGGFMHLLFNMLMLWMFGAEFESMWGGRRFLRFYILCGLGGALCSLMFNYGSPSAVIGASGAIYGIFAAYWRHFPNRTLHIYFVIPVKVRYAIPGLFLFGFLFGGEGIAHFAHFGGAIVGLALSGRRSSSVGRKSFSFKESMRNRKKAKLESKIEENRREAGDVMRRVDSILDRINEVGLENISDEDRKFLEQAGERMSGDKKHKP